MRDLFKTVVDWKVCKTLAKTQILCNFSPGCQMTLIHSCFNPKTEQFGNQKGVFHKILSWGNILATKDFTTYQWPPVMWKREWVKSLTLCFLNPDLFVQEKCWQDLRSVASFRLAKEFWFPTKYPQLHWQPAGHNFGPCYDKKEIHVLTLPSLQHHHTNHLLQIHQKTGS